jgi:hypothetical protein
LGKAVLVTALYIWAVIPRDSSIENAVLVSAVTVWAVIPGDNGL